MSEPQGLDVELLEPLLQEFVALVGLAKTMLIVDTYGGLQLYIAAVPHADSALARLVGLESALALGKEFGLTRLRIPKAGAALRAIRDRRIRADHAHKSLRELVLAYGLSERRICEILAADPAGAGAGPGLFD
ncbi:MAG: hypothetical protein E6Q67_05130 [Roseateles sp.]|nr:MAG: hypothetical protein E6Q67_05130 [Roseateles sp.]